MTKQITLNITNRSDIVYELQELSTTDDAASTFLRETRYNGWTSGSNIEIMRTFTADNNNSLAFQIVEAYCLLKSRMNRTLATTIANAVVDDIVA